MGDIKVIKSLVGDTYEIQTGIANETLEAGDLCNFDANSELEKVDDGDTAQDFAVVLEDAEADQTGVRYVWADPWILLEGTQTGDIGEVGELLEVDIDSSTCTVAPATGALARFVIRSVEDEANKVVRFTRITGAGLS